jgi:hypothetical protein
LLSTASLGRRVANYDETSHRRMRTEIARLV